MSRSHHQTEQRSNKRAKISRYQDCTIKQNKMKIPKGSKYQDRTLEKKKGSERNAKDMSDEGILSTFSLFRKIMIKKMNCKISRSQPTTEQTKKVHNIKIATTKRAKKFII